MFAIAERLNLIINIRYTLEGLAAESTRKGQGLNYDSMVEVTDRTPKGSLLLPAASALLLSKECDLFPSADNIV